jgi:hypothetical protein
VLCSTEEEPPPREVTQMTPASPAHAASPEAPHTPRCADVPPCSSTVDVRGHAACTSLPPHICSRLSRSCFALLTTTAQAALHTQPRAQGAELHPSARAFLGLSAAQLAARYRQRHPAVDSAALRAALSHAPTHVFAAAAQLAHVTGGDGHARMMLLDVDTTTAACGRGIAAMPLHEQAGAYTALLARSFMPRLRALPGSDAGELTVVYDDDEGGGREHDCAVPSGFAAALAALSGERVHLVPLRAADDVSGGGALRVRFAPDGVMEVRVAEEEEPASRCSDIIIISSRSSDSGQEMCESLQQSARDEHSVRDEESATTADGAAPPLPRWVRIRGCVRHAPSQRPWRGVPADTPTLLLHPLPACVAGGRASNRSIAVDAFAEHSAHALAAGTGLAVRTPHAVAHVAWRDVAAWVAHLGGCACIKAPQRRPSGSGQRSTYMVTCDADLAAFQAAECAPGAHRGRQQYIVQALLGSEQHKHVGTVPDGGKCGDVYAWSLHMTIAADAHAGGFRAVALHGARARAPLTEDSSSDGGGGGNAWRIMLDTTLDGDDDDRLMMADCRGFDAMGIGLDELVDAFVQACLAAVALDGMACRLAPGGVLSAPRLLSASNQDEELLSELLLPHHADGERQLASDASWWWPPWCALGAAAAAPPAIARNCAGLPDVMCIADIMH